MSEQVGQDGAGAKRRPSVRRASAVGPLDSLPLFLQLAGKKALVCGSGVGAAWKCDLIAAAGAEVTAFAPHASPEFEEATFGDGRIRIVRAHPRAEDFHGVAIAVIDDDDFAVIEAFRAAAHVAGAWVNVVDKPEYCDFSFGSIVNRSPLVVGIATGGAAPVFGQAVRARIEAILPESFGGWARAAKALRPRVAERDLTFSRRRKFWEGFVEKALSDLPPPHDSSDLERVLNEGLEAAPTAGGRIILVGAGPGDPDLLTLKAVRALQAADVVLFDDLAPEGVLRLARREARRINVGKRGHAPSVGQQDISDLLVAYGRQGKTVVRLKGGDPSVFGRANEELAAAQAAGLACEIVPGITAALAAAASLGVSLSERERARRIQFITAHAADGTLPKGMEWRALVDRDAVTAVYMGVKTLPALVERLLLEGLDPATPAVLVENASLPEERRIAATVSAMPGAAAAAKPTGPCILLYGQTMDRAAEAAAKPATP